MKYLLFLIMLFCGAIDLRAEAPAIAMNRQSGNIHFATADSLLFSLSGSTGEKLLERIDLSFFRNRTFVSLYRYRLQSPAGLNLR